MYGSRSNFSSVAFPRNAFMDSRLSVVTDMTPFGIRRLIRRVNVVVHCRQCHGLSPHGIDRRATNTILMDCILKHTVLLFNKVLRLTATCHISVMDIM